MIHDPRTAVIKEVFISNAPTMGIRNAEDLFDRWLAHMTEHEGSKGAATDVDDGIPYRAPYGETAAAAGSPRKELMQIHDTMCHALDDLVEVRDDTTLIDDDQNAELSRIGYAQLAVVDRMERFLDDPAHFRQVNGTTDGVCRV